MTSITQTVEITDDHKLQLSLQLPNDLPKGKVEMTITFRTTEDQEVDSLRALLPPELAGSVKVNGDLLQPLDVQWEAQR